MRKQILSPSTGAAKQVTPTEALSLRGLNTSGGGDSSKFEIAIYNPANADIVTYFNKRYPL